MADVRTYTIKTPVGERERERESIGLNSLKESVSLCNDFLF